MNIQIYRYQDRTISFSKKFIPRDQHTNGQNPHKNLSSSDSDDDNSRDLLTLVAKYDAKYETGDVHRSTMSKVVKTRAHLMAARLQIHEHNNLTAKFLKREGNSRSVLGDHWKDIRVSIRAKRRLVQSISFEFPCAANFKKWGWQESDKCRLCKSLSLKQPAFSECLGHIQGYYKALQKSRIAVYHGIWRDLSRHIGK